MPGLMAYQLIALPGVLALGPVVADRDLGGAAAWGVITAAFGVGTILGNVAALRIRPSRPMLVATLAFIGCSTQPIAIALGNSTAVIAGAAAARRDRGLRSASASTRRRSAARSRRTRSAA